ncbi:methyltransferase domain-containing protein, partial [Staphylococcus aureus]
AMENGASSVVGVDISHKMLEVAKGKTHFPQIEYECCAIEDVDFPKYLTSNSPKTIINLHLRARHK